MPEVSYETSVVVNAPVDMVYDYIADFPRHVEWNHQPTRMIAVKEGPVQVGSQYQTYEKTASNLSFGTKMMFAVMGPISKLMWGSADYTLAEITALEPNQRVAWKARAPSTKKGDLMRMNWEILLQPQNGATKVVQRCQIVPPTESPMFGMVNEGTAAQGCEEATANLQRMRSIIEGG
ncbi:MAG: SRPBCC family protein [Anaerolineae bacterium]